MANLIKISKSVAVIRWQFGVREILSFLPNAIGGLVFVEYCPLSHPVL